ncbi:MAG TPA: hypothetical protein VFU47_12525, partial [Armatimonadota bacterium]|nr:hypothetical protein [Armatimonadota bacterium]
MARPHKQKKQNKPVARPSRNPSPPPAAVNAPPELQAVLDTILRIARESPEGWGTVAGVLKEQDQIEPEVFLEFVARNMGREVLPLLRGAALDEDDTLATAALKALPLVGTRAAGDVLVEAYAAHPEGERAVLAWQGVQALQARGINVSVPEPDGVQRTVVPAFNVREVFASLPDGVGSRSVYARAQDRYGVWQTVAVVWNDRAGVKDGF